MCLFLGVIYIIKKIIVLFFTVACIAGLLISCSEKNNNATITMLFDANRNYTGFSNLPKKYTIEDAKKDGYVVKQDLEVIANNEMWVNFVETATQGNNTGIRMVSFYTEDTTSPYYSDLFFNDGYYYLFDSSSDKQDMQPFSYLLTLKGQFGQPSKDRGVVVLTNDNTLTFDVVMKSMVSSSFDYIKSVSPYRVVDFIL